MLASNVYFENISIPNTLWYLIIYAINSFITGIIYKFPWRLFLKELAVEWPDAYID